MSTLIGFLLSTIAWAGTPERLVAAHDAPTWEVVRSQLVDDATVTDDELEALTAASDWRVSLGAASVHAWREDAATAQAVWDVHPSETRNGMFRFPDAVPSDVGAVVAERLIHGGGSSAERRALTEWLRRSGVAFTPWITGALTGETDPAVREVMVALLRYGQGPAVTEGLEVGLADGEPSVRSAAVQAIGWAERTDLVPQLIRATADPDDGVAGFASRTLGWLEATEAYDAVASVLLRDDALARLHALRALERIDPTRASTDPRVAALHDDDDARVARAAHQLTTD